MTIDSSPTDGATPLESETVLGPSIADQLRPGEPDVNAVSATTTVEDLAADLAREPQPTADKESAVSSQAVTAVSAVHRPGLAGFVTPDIL